MNTYIFGAGGHGRVVLDILKSRGVVVDGFIDSAPKVSDIFGVPVFPESQLEKEESFRIVVALGANHIRRQVVTKIYERFPRAEFINAIHSSAYISPMSRIGVGNVIAAGAVITPATTIGSHTVINTGAQVDHDCVLSDFVTVAPGAVLGGGVCVGAGAYVAIGAVVRHSISIGEWSVIGAGSLVIAEVPGRVVAFGSPCKVVRSRNENDPYL